MPIVETLSGAKITINLGARDFEQIRSDVLDTGGLADSYTPYWTDRSELDPGVMLTEGFAAMVDVLSYYLDRYANEGFLKTSVLRKSVIKHVEPLNYTLSPRTAASVNLTFVTNGAGTMPALTKIYGSGADSQSFELAQDFVSTGAGTYTLNVAYHGTTVSETVGSSDGSPSQQFELLSSPLALEPTGTSSLHVYVAEGGPALEWTHVEHFLESEATDKHYRYEIDENDIITVIFGDGVNGKIPASGTNNVSAVYRIGGGIVGNQVGAGTLTQWEGVYSFIDSVTNPSSPSGGLDAEDIDTAKTLAPLSLKSMQRCVSYNDYAARAMAGVPGVRQAFAYRGTGAYEVRVVIAAGGVSPTPSGSWNPYTETGTGLLGAAGAYLNAIKTTPTVLIMEPARKTEVYLVGTIHAYNTIRKTDALRYVQDALLDTISSSIITLGTSCPQSLVHDIVEDISGIDYFDLFRFQRIPWARSKSLNAVGNGTFDNIIVDENTNRERWTIQFLSPTAFYVSGSVAGNQSGLGIVGTQYITDNSELSFTVTAGTTAFSAADKYEINVGPYLGNIEPDYDEIVNLSELNLQLTVVGGLG